MRKTRFCQGVLVVSLLALGALTPQIFKSAKNNLEPDNIEYDQPKVMSYDKPDIYYKAPVSNVTSASSISIHYHNDDALCNTREFWVWCAGVYGSAFSPTSVSTDKKDMVLEFSFTGDHANFANKKGIYFIVKFQNTWTGQSENVYIDYAEFAPDASGKSEVWCIPGEGNQIEKYPNEALTKMDRFMSVTFTGWKTIEVIATTVPQTYALYGLTSNYMANQMMIGEEGLPRYQIASGSNPTCTDVTYNSLPCKKFTITLNYTAKVNVQYLIRGIFPEYPDYTKTRFLLITHCM